MRKIILTLSAIAVLGIVTPAGAFEGIRELPEDQVPMDLDCYDCTSAVDFDIIDGRIYIDMPLVMDFYPEAFLEAITELRDEVASDELLGYILDLRGVRDGLVSAIQVVYNSLSDRSTLILVDESTGEGGIVLARYFQELHPETVVAGNTWVWNLKVMPVRFEAWGEEIPSLIGYVFDQLDEIRQQFPPSAVTAVGQ